MFRKFNINNTLPSFVFVTFVMILLTSTCCSEETYVNKKGHFSLTLPNGWGVIPEEAMKSYNQDVKMPFDVGFHKNMKEHPYVLVLIDERGQNAINEMQQLISESKSEDSIANLAEMMMKADNNTMVYDKSKSMIFTKLSGTSQDGRRISYVNVNVLSKLGAVYLYYYDLENNFKNELNDFEKIINSFNFEENFKYASGDTNKPEVDPSKVLTKGYVNGYGLDEMTEREKNFYLLGCVDTLYYSDHKLMARNYPDTIKKNIMSKVIQYYKENPQQKDRVVTDVIYTGCRTGR